MAKKKKSSDNSTPSEKSFDDKIEDILEQIREIRKRDVFPLFLFSKASISPKTVDDVFRDLRKRFKNTIPENLDVIIESSGGSIDAAYNLGLLLRRYAQKDLTIIIPRWAKSAATVVACSGNSIEMTPIAEIGPVDPQITMLNPMEKRLEEFSPLDIDSTLELIRDEFKNGNPNLAKGLLERLQFPLTLGNIKKSLSVGEHYLEKLLSTRMLTGSNAKKAKTIAKRLVNGYSTHSFCIEVDEAFGMGLVAKLIPDNQIEYLWELRDIFLKKEKARTDKKKKEMNEMIKKLPPELLKNLPTSIVNQHEEEIKDIK